MNTDTLERIKAQRRMIYGDPRTCHAGIASMWAPLLRPHWLDIKLGRPVAEHVVALLMAAFKLNRMKEVFSADNYDDIQNYLGFAREWQAERPSLQRPIRQRIFVAGPYSSETGSGREENVHRAASIGLDLVRRGHFVHVPHTMTHNWHGDLPYEEYIDMTFNILDEWATAFYLIAHSPGADRELGHAQALGLTIYESLDDVPMLRDPTRVSPRRFDDETA